LTAFANVIVHINGWPGSGKLTIAKLLAPMLGAKLVDNHTLMNPAEMLFSRGDPLYRSLRAAVRETVFDHIVRAEPAASYVFTDALSDDEFDTAQFEHYRVLAERRQARLVPVVLDCSEDENRRRLEAAGRAERHKLVDVSVLDGLRAKHRLLRFERALALDVTDLTVDAAATRLARLIGESLS